MKLAIVLFVIATTVAGCAATFEDRWAPVKPLLENQRLMLEPLDEWNGGKRDRNMDHLRPAKSSTKSQLAFGD